MRKFKFYAFMVSLFLWGLYIWGSQVVLIPGLINPDEIKIDENQIYFIDGISIHIYSLNDFRFKKKFGKEGEGPQEFLKHPQTALTVDVSTDYITVNCMSRVSYFTKDGNFKKAVKTLWPQGGYIPFGNNFVGWRRVREENNTYATINIFDAGFKNPRELSRRKTSSLGGEIHLLRGPRTVRTCWDRVFIAHKKDFIIDVFDKNGNKLYSIEKEYKKLKISGTHKEGIIDYFRKDPRFRAIFERFQKRLRFPPYFPAIRDFNTDNGKLYVRTYKKSQGKTDFFILSLEGKLLRTVFLPIVEKDGKESYPYIIKNKNVYQLVENSDEEWELHIHSIKIKE